MRRTMLLCVILVALLGVATQCVSPLPTAERTLNTPQPAIPSVAAGPTAIPAPFASSPLPTPPPAIIAHVEVRAPIEFGMNVPITITARSDVAMPALRVVMAFWQGSAPLSLGKPEWHVNDVKPDQTVQLTTTLVFPVKDRYLLRPEFWGGNYQPCWYPLVIDLSDPMKPLVATATPYPLSTTPPNPPSAGTPAPARVDNWTPSPATMTPNTPRATP